VQSGACQARLVATLFAEGATGATWANLARRVSAFVPSPLGLGPPQPHGSVVASKNEESLKCS